MATLELDIIKQQTIKLLPKQKLELIEYLSKSLTPKENGHKAKLLQFGKYQIPASINPPPRTSRSPNGTRPRQLRLADRANPNLHRDNPAQI